MRSARAPAIRELAHRRRSRVLAGIDTHKDTLAVAVIDDAGRPVVVTELANTETGFTALEQLLVEHAVRRVGIEGSGNYGRGAAVHLVLTGPAEVVEVPPSLTSRERSGRPGGGKTDPVDAVAIARTTAREPGLPAVRLAVGQAADLRALADYRAQLVAERTALANRTHAELHGLLPGYQAQIPRLTAPTFITAAKDLLAGQTSVRAQLTRRRLIRLAELTIEIGELKALIAAAVAEVDTGLTDLYGLGPIGAATVLGEGADIRRYLRRRQRHRPAAGLLRPHHQAPAQPLGQPHAASSALHDGHHPDPRRHRRPRLLPAQTRRRQDQPRSSALPETTPVRRRLQDPAGRPLHRPSTPAGGTVSAAAAKRTRLHGRSQLRDRLSVPDLLFATASPPHPPPARNATPGRH